MFAGPLQTCLKQSPRNYQPINALIATFEFIILLRSKHIVNPATSAPLRRFLEALPETGRILIDDLAGQMAGTVLHIDHQRCPAVKLHPG